MFNARNTIGTLWLPTWQDQLRMLIGVAYARLTHTGAGNVNNRS
jgi:hypothetical protein